jgi:hypothetical protein
MSVEPLKSIKDDQVILHLIQPNVWRAAPVDEDPSVQLVNWQIQHMKEGSFFMGREVRGTGRVSTDIVQYDEAKQRGITKSGRVYELVGSPGWDSDAEYVWNHYKRINKLTELET